jgi:protein-disulfide isomerase-like protein with CxxC motif
MAHEFRLAQERLAGRAAFDLMLGGINTHGTQPIGDYGKRFLMRLWREVAETTGQEFGFTLPEKYVHNSSLPCMAIEVVRETLGAPPFEYLHALQAEFFRHGRDINDIELLCDVAASIGVDPQRIRTRVYDPGLQERVRFQFDNANSFGTNALPSLLIERDGKLQLFAGGYVDAEMLCELLPA